MTIVYIGLGSNLGQPKSQLRDALVAIDNLPNSKLLRHSSFYGSTPMGPQDQPDFYNAAALINTTLPPRDVMAWLLSTEQAMGRTRLRRWGERCIDLDLLLYDELSLENDDLVIPHPRILDRDFVLLPLLDLNPELSHPFWAPKTLKSALSGLQQKFVENDPEPWELTD